MRRLLPLIATGALLLAGCSDDPAEGTDGAAAPTTQPAAQMPPSTDACPDMLDATKGKEIRFGIDGATNLGGVLAGTGATGIVLVHQSGGDVCQWKDIAPALIGKGYQVLAFDVQGTAVSQTKEGTTMADDVVAAAATLRSNGASKVALMGASMGGTVSLAGAAKVDPPVAAVVALSSPAEFEGISATEAVPQLKMPLLFAANQDDGKFATDATAMHKAATASSDAQVKVTPGSVHGYELLVPPGDKGVRDAVNAFLTKHAPAG